MRQERMRGVSGGSDSRSCWSPAWPGHRRQARPPGKLTRLVVAVAPLGWDTNLTWLQSRSGMLDKRPALEYLVGIDRHTGAYIPELAEQWTMAPDGKSWTLRLRQGVPFHEQWGLFTAQDVRHSIFLMVQPESTATDAGLWRTLMGIDKQDTLEAITQKLAQRVEIVHELKSSSIPPSWPRNWWSTSRPITTW